MDGYDILGVQKKQVARQETKQPSPSVGYDLLGVPDRRDNAGMTNGYSLLGMEKKLPPTSKFTMPEYLEMALTPQNIMKKIGETVAKIPGATGAISELPIIKAAKAGGEAVMREEAVAAKGLTNMQEGESPFDWTQALAGPASLLALSPEESEWHEGYVQLGDVFQNMGWNEGASATAGLASSLLLPTNFMMVGFGGKTLKESELLLKAKNLEFDSISRAGVLKDFKTSQAALEHMKGKLSNFFKDDFADETITKFKKEILEAPDAQTTKSIYKNYKELAGEVKILKEKSLTPGQKFKKQLKKIYNDSISTARVFNDMDGFKSYKGTNAKLGKGVYLAERNSQVATTHKTASIMDKLTERGINTVSMEEDDLARLTMNSLVEQGDKEGALVLAKSRGLSEVPALAKNDRTILDTVIEVVNENKKDLAYLYSQKTGKGWVDVPNYAFSKRYVDEIEPSLNHLIGRGQRAPKSNQSAKFLERVENQHVPRHDFFKMVEETIAQQEYFLNVIPEVDNIRQTFRFIDKGEWGKAIKKLDKNSPELTAKSKALKKQFDAGQAYRKEFAGKITDNTEYWGRLLTAMEERGNLVRPASWDGALKAARGNITQATLAFKPSTMLLQGGTAFDAMAFMIPEYGVSATRDLMMELTKTWFKPGYAKEVIKGSKGLTARSGAGEEVIKLIDSEVTAFRKAKSIQDLMPSLTGSAASKAKKVNQWLVQKGMAGLKGLDMRTAAGVQSALKKVLKKHGIKQVDDEADFLMTLINASPDVSMRPMVLNYGEGAKMFFTFKTFFLYRWSLLSHDLITAGMIHGDYQKKMLSLLSTGMLMAGQVAEDEARKVIYEGITGQDLPEKSLGEQAMFTALENIPFFGDIASAMMRGSEAQPPLIRQMSNAAKGVYGTFANKTKEGKVRAASRAVESTLALSGLAGVSAVGQVAKRALPKAKPKTKRNLSKTQKMRNQLKRGL